MSKGNGMEEGKHSGKERRYKYPGERIFNAEYLFTWGEEANSQTLCVGFLKGDGPIFRKAKRRKTSSLGVRRSWVQFHSCGISVANGDSLDFSLSQLMLNCIGS